jgi:hypothetical protein
MNATYTKMNDDQLEAELANLERRRRTQYVKRWPRWYHDRLKALSLAPQARCDSTDAEQHHGQGYGTKGLMNAEPVRWVCRPSHAEPMQGSQHANVRQHSRAEPFKSLPATHYESPKQTGYDEKNTEPFHYLRHRCHPLNKNLHPAISL